MMIRMDLPGNIGASRSDKRVQVIYRVSASISLIEGIIYGQFKSVGGITRSVML